MATTLSLPGWLKAFPRQILLLIDLALVATALGAAYSLRGLDTKGWLLDFTNQMKNLLPLVVLIQVFLFWALRLYRGLLRYAGIEEVKIIFVAATIMAALLLALDYVYATQAAALPTTWPLEASDGRLLRIPKGVVAMNWMLTILLVGGFRFSRRIVLSTFRRRNGRNVIIVGVAAGESAARVMLQNPHDGYDPVGFIDPDPARRRFRIHGLRVLGGIDDLPRVIRDYAVQEVVIALPEVGGREIGRIADLCRAQKAEVKILPSVSNIMSGQVSVSAIRPVTIEDILGREPVRLELPSELDYIAGRTVLVTGAGGSIGAEIVAQIMPFAPRRVVLLGRGENSLFEMAARLAAPFTDDRFPMVVANVCDRDKMATVFERYRPDVVFHAAAHKHVPLMETNPEEAVRNNIFGTATVAELADRYEVGRFILISSDKAVRPTNVMGASKRVGEMVVWRQAARSKTRFLAVRFGNVLGSRGSVVPTLQRQIARGGPVTITHRDMTRFFMTIPEAAGLVVQAGALADWTNGGPAHEAGRERLFVLDMGEPVRILDLVHNLITLSGFVPGRDIEIVEIGPRPGEKIHEELLTADETVRATRFGKIFITEPDQVEPDRLAAALEVLRAAMEASDGPAIRQTLEALVPDYAPAGVGVGVRTGAEAGVV